MAYIVLDLEWNMGSVRNSFGDPLRAQGAAPFNEIVQIGAMICDRNFGLTGPYDVQVRAEVHSRMNPYVKNVTGLTTADLRRGLPFPEAWSEFLQWVHDNTGYKLNDPAHEGAILLTWGDSDTAVLLENLRHHDLSTDLNLRVIDLQKLYSELLSIQKSQRPALTAALTQVGLEEDDRLRAHDAAADAYYTALILRRLVPYLREHLQTRKSPIRELSVEELAADLIATREMQAPFDADTSEELYDYLRSLGYLPNFRYSRSLRLPFRVRSEALFKHIEQLDLRCPGCDQELEVVKPWDKNKRFRWLALYRCPTHGEVHATVRLRSVKIRTGPIKRDKAGKEIPQEGRPGFNGRLQLRLPKPF